MSFFAKTNNRQPNSPRRPSASHSGSTGFLGSHSGGGQGGVVGATPRSPVQTRRNESDDTKLTNLPELEGVLDIHMKHCPRWRPKTVCALAHRCGVVESRFLRMHGRTLKLIHSSPDLDLLFASFGCKTVCCFRCHVGDQVRVGGHLFWLKGCVHGEET